MIKPNSYIKVTNPKQPWVLGAACCRYVALFWSPFGEQEENDGYDIYFEGSLIARLRFDAGGNLENIDADVPDEDFATLLSATATRPERYFYSFGIQESVGNAGSEFFMSIVNINDGEPFGLTAHYSNVVTCTDGCSGGSEDCLAEGLIFWRDPGGVSAARMDIKGKCGVTHEDLLAAGNIFLHMSGDMLIHFAGGNWSLLAYYTDSEGNNHPSGFFNIETYDPGTTSGCTLVEFNKKATIPAVEVDGGTSYTLNEVNFAGSTFSNCPNEGAQTRVGVALVP